jgi:hypothetical protein
MRALLLLLAAFAVVVGCPAAHADDRADALCRLGILRATQGRLASAESLFVSLLSRSRHDSRALNNLGNLELLRDDPEMALVYYARAQSYDSLDAGIRLNRAVAYSWLGRESESLDEARAGIGLAGSADSAGSLMGVRAADRFEDSEGRAAAKPALSRDRVRAILRAALKRLPADSTGAPNAHPKPKEPQRRPAGPRATDIGEAAAHLYWKR